MHLVDVFGIKNIYNFIIFSLVDILLVFLGFSGGQYFIGID